MSLYTPLPLHETTEVWIRVLDIIASAEPTGELQVRLRIVSLDASHRGYDALSYMWGHEDSENVIMAKNQDGHQAAQPMSIRRNLYEALLAMRREKEDYTIWVDRICINQGDVEERDSQVALMGLIYWHAKAVQIWLGTAESQLAPKAFLEMNNRCTGFFGAEDRMPRASPSDVRSAETGAWDCIRILYARDWFTRAWVQQELGLSADGDFWWGPHRIGINRFCEFLLWLQGPGSLFMALAQPPICVQMTVTNWVHYGRATRPHWSGADTESFNAEKNFLFMLACGYIFRASDPRDHIYAFLGHPSSRRKYAYKPISDLRYDQVLRQHPRPVVLPSYGTPLEEVFYDTACALFNQHQDLTPLATVYHDQASLEEEYPSWVTRWGVEGTPHGLGFIPGAHSWNASLMSHPNKLKVFTIEPDCSLRVSGYFVDQIQTRINAPESHVWSGIEDVLFARLSIDRYVFSTVGGRRVLGPKVAGQGDHIVILKGSYVPCILREHGPDYKFIGTAIVEGIMQGEVLRGLDQGATIDIRLI